jgi:lipoate-protein ligase A
VVIGSSERPEEVVDAEACARLGVDVLKRSTGGGSVLQTGGVLNYSLITPAPANLDPKAGFRPGIDLICAILAAFGVVGRPEGTSDVAVGDRKISGSAQARRWKALLVHGTLLADFRAAIERIALDATRQVFGLVKESDYETLRMDVDSCGCGTWASAPSAPPAIVGRVREGVGGSLA